MSFTEKKRQEIKKYILRKIAADDADMAEKTKDNFGISMTSVKRYLKDYLEKNYIEESRDVKCGYKLIDEKYEARVLLSDGVYTEDSLCRAHIVPHLKNCSAKAQEIWQYVCMEILNNALEHSGGSEIRIHVTTNCLYTTVSIVDDGRGAFTTLLDSMKDRGWKGPQIEDAVVELLKGKITSAPLEHSGEGIFFTSKMVNQFFLWADDSIACWGNTQDLSVVKSHILAYSSRIGKVGTYVMMTLENETETDIKKVFDTYADVEQGFYKTVIPVYSACLYAQPVARSQARRICKRLEEFKEVILDFADVDFMGQGFSDEIFRVYALKHPEVTIRIQNATSDVVRMVYHVARGNMPENIAFA